MAIGRVLALVSSLISECFQALHRSNTAAWIKHHDRRLRVADVKGYALAADSVAADCRTSRLAGCSQNDSLENRFQITGRRYCIQQYCGGSKLPREVSAKDMQALGPSDNSDSGSDVMGACGDEQMTSDSDASGTGERSG